MVAYSLGKKERVGLIANKREKEKDFLGGNYFIEIFIMNQIKSTVPSRSLFTRHHNFSCKFQKDESFNSERWKKTKPL